MNIDELKNLYTKLLYQETLDLDDDGARYILQDLVGDEIDRLRNGQTAMNQRVIRVNNDKSMV